MPCCLRARSTNAFMASAFLLELEEGFGFSVLLLLRMVRISMARSLASWKLGLSSGCCILGQFVSCDMEEIKRVLCYIH